MEKGKYPELLLTRSLSHINENFDKAVAGFDFWGLNEDFIDLVASIHPRNDEPQMITLRLSQEPRAVILDKYSNWSPEIAEQIIGSCRYILTTEYVQDIKHLTRSIITNLNSLSPNSALTSFMAFDEFESLQLNELTYEA
jgi:hypothetical protein